MDGNRLSAAPESVSASPKHAAPARATGSTIALANDMQLAVQNQLDSRCEQDLLFLEPGMDDADDLRRSVCGTPQSRTAQSVRLRYVPSAAVRQGVRARILEVVDSKMNSATIVARARSRAKTTFPSEISPTRRAPRLHSERGPLGARQRASRWPINLHDRLTIKLRAHFQWWKTMGKAVSKCQGAFDHRRCRRQQRLPRPRLERRAAGPCR